MTVFDRYLEQAKDFARRLVRQETGTRRWATVTSVDPILITYDGPAPQGIISPVVLGAPVTLGDRVRAHTIHDKTYITLANPTGLSGSVSPSGGVTGTIEWRVSGDVVQVLYDLTGAVTADTHVATLPAAMPSAPALVPAAEYLYGAVGFNPTYLGARNLRVPAQSGVTRRRGSIVYLRSI